MSYQLSRGSRVSPLVDALRDNKKDIAFQESPFATCLNCSMMSTEALWLEGPAAYGLRYRELERWAPYVKKFIFLPGTTRWSKHSVFQEDHVDPYQKSLEYFVPAEDLFDGLERAIDQFLREHSDWAISYEYKEHSYGLTILIRRERGDYVGPL
jgi:hypothetical protein